MSEGEIIALVVSAGVGLIGWKGWLRVLFLKAPMPRSRIPFFTIAAPLICVAAMGFVLMNWASHDVRSDTTYIAFYLAMWFGWTGALNLLLPYVGLICHDDVFERGNPAAGLAIGGALIGLTFVFAGGNIGDGPGWWVVIFSAGLATGTLVLLWIIGNGVGHVEEHLTVDRDVAAGWRVAGLFIGSGLILGRAVAGNWISAGQTLFDFAIRGWPVLMLWAAAIAMDLFVRPSPAKPAPSSFLCGMVPGALFAIAGLVIANLQGPW